MNWFWRTVLALALTGVLAAALCLWYVQSSLAGLDAYRPAARETYELKEGVTVRQLAVDLVGGRYPEFIVRYWLRQHPELAGIQKGVYALSGGLTLAEVLGEMVAGHVIVKTYPKVTLVEGASWYEFFPRLQQLRPAEEELAGLIDAPRKFIRDTLGEDGLAFMGAEPGSLEGLMMPATYPVFDQQPAAAVIRRALTDMLTFLRAEWEGRDAELALVASPYEALVLASIIERETLVADERPQVAAVFYNRLKSGMRLQTDPSVMYGVDPLFRGRLTRQMLTRDTAYNTYTRAGLPPTPIGMPGRASVQAALHPDRSDALYFVARGVSPRDGHVFSTTLAGHNKAVAEYRQKVRDYRAGQKTELKSDGDESAAGTAESEKATDPDMAAEAGKVHGADKTVSGSGKNGAGGKNSAGAGKPGRSAAGRGDGRGRTQGR